MGSLAFSLTRSAPDGARVRTMLRAAPHRGEPGRIESLGAATVGVSGDDSSVATGGGRLVAFSGVLDNHADLSAALVRGHPASSPAQTILQAWSAWGDRAPARLRGVFAAVVTDGVTATCFRDQLGFVPLHASRNADAYLGATEAKQVVAGTGRAAEPDLDGIRQHFYGHADNGRTALQRVRRIPRATIVRIGPDGRSTTRRYWDPRNLVETAPLGIDEARERFRHLLDRAVRRCMTGDDGLSLSGGLDSPAIAVFASPHARERWGRPLRALTAVFPDHPDVDEREWVELVCAHLGIELETHRLQAGPLEDLEHWVDVLDGPATTLIVPELAEEYSRAQRAGVRTVLTGELAEYVYGVHKHLLGHLLLHGRVDAFVRRARGLRARGRPLHRIAREVLATATPSSLAARMLGARRHSIMHLPGWIHTAPLGELGYRSDLARPPRSRWSGLQAAALRGDSVAFETDEICASFCGVTVRRPFADVDLWEFFLSLRAEVKYPDVRAKSFAREALRGLLPDALLDRRRKTVFDDHYLAMADYPALRKRIIGSDNRLPWIDYDMLDQRLEQAGMRALELRWANDLAWIHGFLDRW